MVVVESIRPLLDHPRIFSLANFIFKMSNQCEGKIDVYLASIKNMTKLRTKGNSYFTS